MRFSRWIGAAAIIVALSGNARAQVANTFQVPATPNIQFTPVDTSAAIAPSNLTGANSNGFSFTGFFRRLMGFGSPTIGQSNIPGAQYAPAISPLPPIPSTVQVFR